MPINSFGNQLISTENMHLSYTLAVAKHCIVMYALFNAQTYLNIYFRLLKSPSVLHD